MLARNALLMMVAMLCACAPVDEVQLNLTIDTDLRPGRDVGELAVFVDGQQAFFAELTENNSMRLPALSQLSPNANRLVHVVLSQSGRTVASGQQYVDNTFTADVVVSVAAAPAGCAQGGKCDSADPTFSCQQVSSIPALECEALLALYDSAAGEDWLVQSDWHESEDPCTWFGVVCASGHVSRIDLKSNNLKGTIPKELGTLEKLEWLWLFDNKLEGSIPSELSQLTELTTLYLSHNSLSGPVPGELGALSKLQWLYADHNQLSGSIPHELGQLRNLEAMTLSDNKLSGSIPPRLGRLANANTLSLSHNQLTGSIPSELSLRAMAASKPQLA